MKILLFGGSGQLGREVLKRCDDLNFEVVSPVPSEVSLDDRPQIDHLIQSLKPTVIINCAAYTNVDGAESDRTQVELVNAVAPGWIAQAAAQYGIKFIHLSTDYVFGDPKQVVGAECEPFREDSQTSPCNFYGLSKLKGEEAALSAMSDGVVIVRTSSLHGKFGKNFVHTMLDLFKGGKTVEVVNDQFMRPTWAGWLAEVLLDLARLMIADDQKLKSVFDGEKIHGVLHASCSGELSWYDFAVKIFSLAGGKEVFPNVEIKAVSALHYKRAAKRACYTVLDCSRLEQVLLRPVMKMEEGLRRHLTDIGQLKQE